MSPRETPEADRRSRTAPLLILLLLVAVTVTGWLLLRSCRRGATPTTTAEVEPPRAPPISPRYLPRLPPGASTRPPPALPGVGGPGSPLGQAYQSTEGLKRMLERYKQAKRYPSSTLRLHRKMTDILQPDRYFPTTAPFVRRKDDDRDNLGDPDEQIFSRFEASRAAAVDDDEVELRLAVYQGQKTMKPLKVALQPVIVLAAQEQGWSPAGTVSLGEYGVGTPGEGQYRTRLKPRTLVSAGFSGYLRFRVTWQAPGERPHLNEVQILYTEQPPATFTGSFTDALVEGSLVIKAGIDVRRPGRYNLTALLFSATRQEPVAMCNTVKTLAVGRQAVELQFYGLVFHDAGIRGPYRLTSLRGHLQVDGGTGRGVLMRSYEGGYVTQDYPLSAFTQEEHTTPNKEFTIKAYEAEIQSREQKAAQGSP